MGVSYKKLWKLLIDKDMKKRQLMVAAKLSPSIITSLNQDQSVTTNTLVKICNALDCGVEDIMEIIPDKKEVKDDG